MAVDSLAKNTLLMGEVPIYVVKVGVWCAMSAAKIF
jgi:hypothetical protein